MKILFLSAHLPSPHARQAGQKISYRLCRHLAHGHRVHLLSFATAAELESCPFQSAGTFDSQTIIPVTTATRIFGIACAPTLPIGVGARSSGAFRRALRSVLQRDQFDVAILDHMAMWQYADQLSPSTLRLGLAHDVLSQLWSRRAENGKGISALTAAQQARRLQAWQLCVVGRLDLICTLSTKDSELLLEIGSNVPQCVLEPWFLRPSDADFSAAVRERNSIVFTGDCDRRENANALEFALDDILPRIPAALPYTFHIAGSASHKFSPRAAQRPRLKIEGMIPDLSSFLCSMQIALLPMRLGAGVKIKVLECMSAGLAVVTTPVGAEGIAGQHGVHFLLGRTAEELAEYTLHLLRDPVLCAEMGRRAQEFVRTSYDFERSVRDFERTLVRASEQRRFPANPTAAPPVCAESHPSAPHPRLSSRA